MKRYNYITIAVFAAVCLFCSCDMDLTPHGEIVDTEALETVDDFEKFVNGIYAQMRSVTSGDYVILSDIQMDAFHAVIGNGNRRMEFYNGSFTPSTAEISAYYSAFYSVIAQTNFFIEYATKKLKDESLTTANKARMQNYLGQVYFFRAYCYNALADKFCCSYKNCSSLDAKGMGLSLQLTYAPTADNKVYPSRSSMRETYAQICSDLSLAQTLIGAYEDAEGVTPEANSIYVTSDAVKALTARVKLNMGLDQDAFNLATDVISRYELVDRAGYKKMWTDDEGSEIIWLVDADFTYHGSATGSAFASNTQNSDYVPTGTCIEMFETNDIRWDAWFEEVNVSNSGGSGDMFRFMKYPGNKELYSSASSSNYVNKAKPFRVSEMYLIAAEASFNTSNVASANNYLKDMKTKRINRYRHSDKSGVELLDAIKEERQREFMGEGMRMTDLKRWNMGFTRGEVWDGNDALIVSNNVDLHYEAGDYRFVWPIPQHEIDANPQLKGQQNPGY